MIRINLLAEELAAAELRRRDPVKRAYFAAGLLAGLTVAWVMYAHSKAAKSDDQLHNLDAQWKKLKTQFRDVTNNRAMTCQIEKTVLPALEKLATNRFLWSHALDALQYCMIDEIELTELLGRHSYSNKGYSVDPITHKTGEFKATSVTEIVTLTLKCNDLAPDAARNHIRFMDNLVTNRYFQENLRKRTPYEPLAVKTPGDPANHKPGVFSFTCYFAPQTRTTCD
jgi:hypothetical protein